jgi:GntR family transcriptional regulator
MTTVLPIYYQIKQTIKGWIVNKEFGPGNKIPSENELADRFNVSRLTVRQAISQLTQEGFLNSRRGEGTFVTSNEDLINSFSLETTGFMDELFSTQLSKVTTKWATLSKMVAPKPVKEKLQLEMGDEEVVQIKRVRLLRGRPFTYTINYLPVEIGARVNEKDLYRRRLLEILERDLKVEFTEAVQTIEASFADQEVAEKLEVASGSPILFVEKIMYSKQHKPIELFQSSYRGDLFKFIVRFNKVKRRNGSQWIHQPE